MAEPLLSEARIEEFVVRCLDAELDDQPRQTLREVIRQAVHETAEAIIGIINQRADEWGEKYRLYAEEDRWIAEYIRRRMGI